MDFDITVIPEGGIYKYAQASRLRAHPQSLHSLDNHTSHQPLIRRLCAVWSEFGACLSVFASLLPQPTV